MSFLHRSYSAVKKTAKGAIMGNWSVRWWDLGAIHQATMDKDAAKSLFVILRDGYSCMQAQLIYGMEVIDSFDKRPEPSDDSVH